MVDAACVPATAPCASTDLSGSSLDTTELSRQQGTRVSVPSQPASESRVGQSDPTIHQLCGLTNQVTEGPTPSTRKPPRRAEVSDLKLAFSTFVIYSRAHRAHAYESGPYSVCRYWRCGTPAYPAPGAIFVDAGGLDRHGSDLCKKYCELVGTSVKVPVKASRPSSTQSSSSAPSTSSSD